MIRFVLLVSLLSYCFQGFSQQIKGVILGEEGPLPGASVIIQGTAIGTVTDLQGMFQINGLSLGETTLLVTFIGYQEDTIKIMVKEGLNELPPITMKAGKFLTEVVVEGTRRNSEAKAMNMMKMSNTIVHVVASDGIGKLPDYNAAEAVQRVPSISIERDQGEGRYVSLRGTPHDWSAALINGDRLPVADELADSRTVAFDVFPSELIEYIIVTKALTPDMEGDAIGGSINFITKAAPTQRTLSVNLGGGLNFQSYGPIANGSILYGNRSKNKKFGYLVASSIWQRSYGTDNYQVIYGSNQNQGLNRLELRDYLGNRRTIGATASMEYNFNDRNRVYAKFIYGGLRDDERHRKTMYNWFVGAGRTVRLQNIHNIMLNRLVGGEIGTDFSLSPKLTGSFRASSYSNRFGYGAVPFARGDARNGYHVIQFERFGLNYEDLIYLDASGNIITNPAEAFDVVKLIEDDHPTGGDPYNNIQPIISEALRPQDFQFTTAYSELNETWERDPIVTQLDFNYRPSSRWTVKFGIKTRLKQGSRYYSLHEWIQDINKKSTAYTLDQFETEALDEKGGFLQELGQPYRGTFMPFLTPAQFESFLPQLGDTLFERTMNPNNPGFEEFVGSRYTYSEQVYAGYGMSEFQISEKVSVLGGLRLEHTALRMEADSLGAIRIFFNPETGKIETEKPVFGVNSTSKYWAVLPSLHVRFSPNRSSNFRVAVTRTFRRPNFNEAKPGNPFFNFTDLVRTFGNPNIRPSFSWNADLIYEYYFGNIGMISFGVFGKAVKDHIFATAQASQDVLVGNSAIGVKNFENAQERSYVAGVEMNFHRRFDFLPGFLNGFGMLGNYSYIWSRMEVPGRSFNQPLPRQAPHLLNLALFYEKSNFQGRLAVNYKAPYLMELNLAATNVNGVNQLINPDTDQYDIFYGSFTSLDLSISYRIGKQIMIYSEWLNLLNTPLRIYRGRVERPVKTEYYSIRGVVGVRFNL